LIKLRGKKSWNFCKEIKIFYSKQARTLNNLAKKVDKTLKKIDLSSLKEEEIELLIKFNKAISNLETVYKEYIKPLEKKDKKWDLKEFHFQDI